MSAWRYSDLDVPDDYHDPRPPCGSCPWRKGATAERIPAYSHTRACGLTSTASDGTDDFRMVMACHLSTEEDNVACAGYLLSEDAQLIVFRDMGAPLRTWPVPDPASVIGFVTIASEALASSAIVARELGIELLPSLEPWADQFKVPA